MMEEDEIKRIAMELGEDKYGAAEKGGWSESMIMGRDLEWREEIDEGLSHPEIMGNRILQMDNSFWHRMIASMMVSVLQAASKTPVCLTLYTPKYRPVVWEKGYRPVETHSLLLSMLVYSR